MQRQKASVRSKKLVIVAGDAGESESLPLSVTITSQGGGNDNGDDNNDSGIVFGVSGNLDFGELQAGQAATKQATITNSSNVNITTTASITGASLFQNNITLDSATPSSWQKQVFALTNEAVDVTLSVPQSYTQTGTETGTIIFWANVTQ